MSEHTAEKDATIRALVRALEKRHGKGKKWALPTIPIGTRVRVHDSGAAGVGTVVGRDGYRIRRHDRDQSPAPGGTMKPPTQRDPEAILAYAICGFLMVVIIVLAAVGGGR